MLDASYTLAASMRQTRNIMRTWSIWKEESERSLNVSLMTQRNTAHDESEIESLLVKKTAVNRSMHRSNRGL